MATTSTSYYMGQERVVVTCGVNETTPWYLLPNGSAGIEVAPVSGTMVAQMTESPMATVLADNANSTSNSIAVSWPQGAVSVNSSLNVSQATAVRFVCAGGGTGTGLIAG